MMQPVSATMQDIICEVKGTLGLVTLNRPAQLNALTLGMIEILTPQLALWAQDPAIRAVVIRGDGSRAFCAGGDVRAVWRAGMEARAGRGDGRLCRDFFKAEYALNLSIHRFPKPYVALIDGIAMGGGLGLSLHGSHRVVSERAVLAMPEMAIGFFCDVGATWFLNQCPGRIGRYIALTGARLDANDALYAGFATHYRSAEGCAAFPDALAQELAEHEREDAGALITRMLKAEAAPPAPGTSALADLRTLIDRCFAGGSVEEICKKLEAEGTDQAKALLIRVNAGSPTSAKVTLAALDRAKGCNIEAVLRTEFTLSQGFMRGFDFYEGIRAMLVDKDHWPRWRPDTLAAVSLEAVEAYFTES